MKQPIVFFLALVFVITGYVMLFTNFNSPTQELNQVIASESIDECFDNTMTTWFEEFNENQENGADMSEADESASKLALASFSNCEE